MTKPRPDCRECGSALTGTHKRKTFCSTECRRAFNNRRQQRGAQMYDFFMDLRYNRDEAKRDKIWGVMCRVAETYRDEDIARRGGRESWMDPRVTIEAHPHLKADRLPSMAMKRRY